MGPHTLGPHFSPAVYPRRGEVLMAETELSEQEKSNITVSQINSIFKKVINPLIEIWEEHGIIHNDLSSGQNIMIDGKNIKIMDFGHAEKDKNGQKFFGDFKSSTIGAFLRFLNSKYNSNHFDISTFKNYFDDAKNLNDIKNIINTKKIKKKQQM